MALFIGQELYRDVVSIDFQQQRIEDKDLRLLRGLDGCERLYLADTSISDAGLAHIAHLTNLKRISLWKTRITNAGLKHLAAMSELEAIDLDHTKVDNNGLRHLGDIVSLRELSMSDWMSDRGLRHLSKLNNLQKLNINRAAVSMRGLEQLSNSTLDTIEADSDYIINKNLKALLRFPNITYIRKVSAKTDDDVALISQRLKPKAIELEGKAISDDSIPAILKLKTSGLAIVSLRGTSISKSGVQKLRKNLGNTVVTQHPPSNGKGSMRRSTNANGQDSMVVYGPSFTIEERQSLANAIDVQRFYIFHAELNEKLLALFTDSHQFEFMFLEHSNITSSDLSTIQQVKRLRLLDATLTPDVIDALAGLPNLESINIERCVMPSDAIARLSRSKSLRRLHLVGRSGFREPLVDQHMHDLKMMTQIDTLDLSHTDFNDDGCVALKNLTNLRNLNLTGTFITGKSRPILEGLPNLEKISVSSRMARVQPAKGNER